MTTSPSLSHPSFLIDPYSPNPQAGNFNIHSIHWSTIMLGGAATIALIVLVAGVALSNIPLMVAGGIYFVACAIGSYYTHTFSEYKSLESHNLMLRQEIESLSANSRINETQTVRLEQATRDLANVRREKQKYEEDQRKKMNDDEQKFLKTLSRIQSINDDLQHKMLEASKSADKEISKLGKINIDLSKEVEQDKVNIQDLETNIQALQKELDRLTRELEEQTGEIERYDTRNKEYDALNKDLQKQIEGLQLVTKASTFNPSYLEKISDSARVLADATRTTESSTAAEAEKNKRLNELVTKLLKRLEKLEKLEAERRGVK